MMGLVRKIQGRLLYVNNSIRPVHRVNNLKVLVVNANKNMRDTLKMMMREHFSEENIILCSNEHDALWYSVETKPDIVIVSYGPRDGNSYGLLKRLRTTIYPEPLRKSFSAEKKRILSTIPSVVPFQQKVRMIAL